MCVCRGGGGATQSKGKMLMGRKEQGGGEGTGTLKWFHKQQRTQLVKNKSLLSIAGILQKLHKTAKKKKKKKKETIHNRI